MRAGNMGLRSAMATGLALVLAAVGWVVLSRVLLRSEPPTGTAASAPDAPAPSWEVDAVAYEATVAVVTSVPQRYQAEARAREFEAELRTRVSLELPQLGADPSYRVTVRPVTGAPLVLVSAQAPVAELASRLAHRAANLLVEKVGKTGSPWNDAGRVVQATCSPPAVVRLRTSRANDRSGDPTAVGSATAPR